MISDRRLELIEFRESNSTLSLKVRTNGDTPGKPTYCGGVGASAIDQVWVNIPDAHRILHVAVNVNLTLADYFPVSLILKGLGGKIPRPALSNRKKH